MMPARRRFLLFSVADDAYAAIDAAAWRVAAAMLLYSSAADIALFSFHCYCRYY